jgi:small GTP-binding protein
MDYSMKVLFLGDSDVGKTSLIWRFVYKTEFQAYKPTIGADFHNKTIQILDESDGLTKKVSMQLWDTAG